jgi:hypothetical protein
MQQAAWPHLVSAACSPRCRAQSIRGRRGRCTVPLPTCSGVEGGTRAGDSCLSRAGSSRGVGGESGAVMRCARGAPGQQKGTTAAANALIGAAHRPGAPTMLLDEPLFLIEGKAARPPRRQQGTPCGAQRAVRCASAGLALADEACDQSDLVLKSHAARFGRQSSKARLFQVPASVRVPPAPCAAHQRCPCFLRPP